MYKSRSSAESNDHLLQSYMLSRRAFLHTMLATAGAASIGSALAACAPAAPAAPQSGAEPAAAGPRAAKKLMAEAGYADGVKGVKMYIGQNQEVGQLLQADLAAIGIETELMVGQWKERRDAIRAGDIPLFVYGWATSFPDAYDYTSAWSTCASI